MGVNLNWQSGHVVNPSGHILYGLGRSAAHGVDDPDRVGRGRIDNGFAQILQVFGSSACGVIGKEHRVKTVVLCVFDNGCRLTKNAG